MSATEVPILDPKNMMFDLPNSRGGITTSIFFDPVAQLSASVFWGGGTFTDLNPNLGYDGGAELANIHFIPKLTREMLVTGDIWTLFREKKIVEVPLVRIIIKYKYIDDMRMGFVDAEQIYYTGFRARSASSSLQKIDSPGFEFWPKGMPGHERSLAVYILHGLIPMIERSSGSINRVDIKRIAIAIDKRLMCVTGPEAFPYNEAVGDKHTMILKGDETNV